MTFEPWVLAFIALPFPLHPVDLSSFSRKPSSHLVTPTDWFLDSLPVGPHLSEQTLQLAVSLEDVAHYDSKKRCYIRECYWIMMSRRLSLAAQTRHSGPAQKYKINQRYRSSRQK